MTNTVHCLDVYRGHLMQTVGPSGFWKSDTPERVPSSESEYLVPTNPAERDFRIGTLGWAVTLLVPYIAVVCFGAAALVGARAAFWIAVGLVGLTVITFALLIAFSALVTLVDDKLQSRLHTSGRS